MILNICENENKVVKIRNHIPTIINPRAFVERYTQLRKGSIVEPMAVIKSGAEICESVLISAGTVVSIDKRSEMNKGVIWFDNNREKNDTASDAV